MILKEGYGQAEGQFAGNNDLTEYTIATQAFVSDDKGAVKGIKVSQVGSDFKPIAGTEQVIAADLILLAMGFVGTDTAVLDGFDVTEIDNDYATNNPHVFVCGDARRGPSLVIWAIREGRKAAEFVDKSLEALIKISV